MRMGAFRDRKRGHVYRLNYGKQSESYRTRTQAIRAMARVVRELPLTKGERFAFDRWYTTHNYRSVALELYRGHRYEMRISVAGKRRLFAIDPPQHPTRYTPQIPVTRQELAV